jgi:hypothetical protein
VSDTTENVKSKPLEEQSFKGQLGGARPNSGRKKGQLAPQTVERAAALQAFRERVAKNVDKLFNAQLNLAMGERYLMVKRTVYVGKEKRTWHEVVEDPEDIKSFLDGDLDNTDSEYYYMSVKPANNMALDSLLDRTFGKAQQNMKLEGDKDNPVVSILKAYGLQLTEETKPGDPAEMDQPLATGEDPYTGEPPIVTGESGPEETGPPEPRPTEVTGR